MMIGESIIRAENEAFELLCEAASATPGRDAHLGMNPYIDAWEFEVQETYSLDASFWAAHEQRAIPLNAVAVCRYATRSECWRWLDRIRAALPLAKPRGVLQQFRIDRVEAMSWQYYQPPNADRAYLAWSLPVDFTLVALCAERPLKE